MPHKQPRSTVLFFGLLRSLADFAGLAPAARTQLASAVARPGTSVGHGAPVHAQDMPRRETIASGEYRCSTRWDQSYVEGPATPPALVPSL